MGHLLAKAPPVQENFENANERKTAKSSASGASGTLRARSLWNVITDGFFCGRCSNTYASSSVPVHNVPSGPSAFSSYQSRSRMIPCLPRHAPLPRHLSVIDAGPP